jgi:hypothetical protein
MVVVAVVIVVVLKAVEYRVSESCGGLGAVVCLDDSLGVSSHSSVSASVVTATATGV